MQTFIQARISHYNARSAKERLIHSPNIVYSGRLLDKAYAHLAGHRDHITKNVCKMNRYTLKATITMSMRGVSMSSEGWVTGVESPNVRMVFTYLSSLYYATLVNGCAVGKTKAIFSIKLLQC